MIGFEPQTSGVDSNSSTTLLYQFTQLTKFIGENKKSAMVNL